MDVDETNGVHFWTSRISSQQQTAIGLYLLFIGVLGSVSNSLVLVTFVKFPNLAVGRRLLLVNLCLTDLGMCLFGFPFSASSSFANEWLYGDAGCQLYAFLGFLFGSASICSVMMLALDKYLSFAERELKKSVDPNSRYKKMLIAIWAYAIFWSVMPLLGWGRTTCTIDWRHNDFAYKSFVISYFLAGFVLPVAIMAFSYYHSSKGHSQRSRKINWTAEKNKDDVSKLSVLLVVAFVTSWSAYAVVCLWTVFANPSTVPLGLSVLPPLMAKASTVFNPLLYLVVEKRLRGAVVGCIDCFYATPSMDSKEIQDSYHIAAARMDPHHEGAI